MTFLYSKHSLDFHCNYIVDLLRFVGVLGHHCIINKLFRSNFTECLESWKDQMKFFYHFEYTLYFCCLYLKWCSCWKTYLVVYATERRRNSKNRISHLRNFNAKRKPENFHQWWPIKNLYREEKYTGKVNYQKNLYCVIWNICLWQEVRVYDLKLQCYFCNK